MLAGGGVCASDCATMLKPDAAACASFRFSGGAGGASLTVTTGGAGDGGVRAGLGLAGGTAPSAAGVVGPASGGAMGIGSKARAWGDGTADGAHAVPSPRMACAWRRWLPRPCSFSKKRRHSGPRPQWPGGVGGGAVILSTPLASVRLEAWTTGGPHVFPRTWGRSEERRGGEECR